MCAVGAPSCKPPEIKGCWPEPHPGGVSFLNRSLRDHPFSMIRSRCIKRILKLPWSLRWCSCANGQVITMSATGWSCAAGGRNPTDHYLDRSSDRSGRFLRNASHAHRSEFLGDDLRMPVRQSGTITHMATLSNLKFSTAEGVPHRNERYEPFKGTIADRAVDRA